MPPQRTLIRVGIKVGTGWIPVLRRDRRQWRGCADSGHLIRRRIGAEFNAFSVITHGRLSANDSPPPSARRRKTPPRLIQNRVGHYYEA